MPLWAWILAAVAVAMLLFAIVALVFWGRQRGRVRDLGRRVLHLPWRAKLGLGRAMFRDERLPLWFRLIVPAVVLYLAMPLDIIPDFIPVLGYLDDVLLLAVAAGVFLRFTPLELVEEYVTLAEAAVGTEL